jgi:predicted alpha/beta-hydrolase family hydrolase
MPQPVVVPLEDGTQVPGLLELPGDARAAYVLAHGAGAGMEHAFMAAMAQGLAGRGIATLRYQFPYMARGAKRPDAPATAQATVRAAVGEAARRLPGLPLFAGGKSFGGRMTSQAQAASPLYGVRGLVFLGFPLHPAGKPSTDRAKHLADVGLPMLFLQGTRDTLADPGSIRRVTSALGALATLAVIEGADHGFHVLVRSGRSDAQVQAEMLDAIAAFVDRLC